MDSGVTLEDDKGTLEGDVGSIGLDNANQFLRLKESSWLDKTSVGRILFIRECYPQIWNKIESMADVTGFGIIGEPHA